jgi:hemolysin III
MYPGERLNSITHLVGAVMAIAGAAVLITQASIFGDMWTVVSTSIYGATMILLYTFSTLYHSLQGRAKSIFQKLDHIAIYLLIAGTYTPFCLISLRGSMGWWLLIANWSLAVVGIIYELTLAHRSRTPSMLIYLVMGWMIVYAMKSLALSLPFSGMLWLAVGGLLYTGGVVFFLLDEKIKHFHGVWHLFVLGGTICQYFCILLYLIPKTIHS